VSFPGFQDSFSHEPLEQKHILSPKCMTFNLSGVFKVSSGHLWAGVERRTLCVRVKEKEKAAT